MKIMKKPERKDMEYGFVKNVVTLLKQNITNQNAICVKTGMDAIETAG